MFLKPLLMSGFLVFNNLKHYIYIIYNSNNMSTNVQIKLRKKTYNPSTDAVNGVMVFDNTTHKIYVGGICFSSDVSDCSLNANTGVLTITKTNNTTITVNLNSFELNQNKVTTLSSSSTDTQYPSAKCVYDMIGDIEATLDVILNGSN